MNMQISLEIIVVWQAIILLKLNSTQKANQILNRKREKKVVNFCTFLQNVNTWQFHMLVLYAYSIFIRPMTVQV